MRWLAILLLCLLPLGLLPLGVSARSTHAQPDQGMEQQAWFGDMLGGFVQAGCLPVPAGSLTVTLPTCQAYARSVTPAPALRYIWDPQARELTLPASQTLWLAAHWSVVEPVAGWTRLPGTHYVWQSATTQGTLPDGAVWLARLVTDALAVSAVEPLAPASPLRLEILAGTVYAPQYGLRCDGASDNSAALDAAVRALPPTGGEIRLPAAALPCRYSRPFQPDRPVHLVGAGMKPGGGGASRASTTLEYTGADAAVRFTGTGAMGSSLAYVDLAHSGTASVGVAIEANANMVELTEVSINEPTVPFSAAGVLIGGSGSVHSTVLERLHLINPGPIGVHIERAVSHTKLRDMRIAGQTSTAAVQLGPQLSRDVKLLDSDLSSGAGSGVKILNSEFVVISRNHMELSAATPHGTYLIDIPPEATLAQNVRVHDNFMNCLANCQGHARVHLLGADLVLSHNDLLNNSGGAQTVYIDNVLARVVLVEDNKLLGTVVPVVSSWARVIAEDNFAINAPQGTVDGFRAIRQCATAEVFGTVGSSETPLLSCLILARQIFLDNRTGVELHVWGRTGATAHTKTIRIKIAGVEVWQVVTTASARTWSVRCKGLRSNFSGMRMLCDGGVDGEARILLDFTGVIGSGWDVDQTVDVTGQGTADGDLTTQGWKVDLLR
jgi:hypothetical protein